MQIKSPLNGVASAFQLFGIILDPGFRGVPREMAIIKNTSRRHVDFMCVQAGPKTVPQSKSKVSWRNIEGVNNLCVFAAFNSVQNTQLINSAS